MTVEQLKDVCTKWLQGMPHQKNKKYSTITFQHFTAGESIQKNALQIQLAEIQFLLKKPPTVEHVNETIYNRKRTVCINCVSTGCEKTGELFQNVPDKYIDYYFEI